ncbi:hypothetical protein ZWY2020_028678 [Hordeum vulgare]|nr:hypothetical protein ZWY2020_028678 [Hordeum vulgare]
MGSLPSRQTPTHSLPPSLFLAVVSTRRVDPSNHPSIEPMAMVMAKLRSSSTARLAPVRSAQPARRASLVRIRASGGSYADDLVSTAVSATHPTHQDKEAAMAGKI